LEDETDTLKQSVDNEKYRQAIGKLMYLMVCTRPDISFAVSLLSRFMADPKERHWRCVKQLLKYVKSSRNLGLLYQRLNNVKLIGYSDSDHAGDKSDRKSTSGYIYMLGSCTVSWKSQKQQIVALSSTESEYIGLATAIQEALWMRSLLKELGFAQSKTIVFGDNQSSMAIAKGGQTNRSKHIDIKYHFIRNHLVNKEIELKYMESEKLCADFLTKGLNKIKFHNCSNFINLISIT
jgi:hypothetical protein